MGDPKQGPGEGSHQAALNRAHTHPLGNQNIAMMPASGYEGDTRPWNGVPGLVAEKGGI